MSSVYEEKKRVMIIAKDIPVMVNRIIISADMKVIDTNSYAVIVGNGWLEEAKALINYKTYQMTIQCVSPPVIVQCQHSSKDDKVDESHTKQEEEIDKELDE